MSETRKIPSQLPAAFVKRYAKLDQKLTILLEDLKKHPDVFLNKSPGDGKWSALQNMYHLMIAEKKSHEYIEKKLSFNPTLKKVGVATWGRATMIKSYMSSPIKIKAPAAVGDQAIPNGLTFWEIAKPWKENRADLLMFLQTMPAEYLDKEIYKHPMGGRLGINGLLTFFETHFERHRKQIYRALDS